MAQHDYDIANQSGANFRADLNNALDAIVSNNSGSSEPSTKFAYEWWIDTSNNLLKLRNSANNAWITLPLSITADNATSGALTVNGNLTTTGTIDVNGQELILDADADTSITADTDDQIDFKIGATDVMTLTNSHLVLKGTTPKITIGDGGEEDTALIFDGNAQDFYIGLDDSADDLVIGTGSTVGTNPKVVVENGGNVGIGEASPLGLLHVKSGESSGSADSGADELVLENSGDAGITILSGTSNSGSIRFGDSDDNDNGIIIYNHDSSPYLRFFTGGSVRARLDSDGLKFGSDTAAANALDDYEEGTWTATITTDGTDFTTSGRSTLGKYTKIGNLVHAHFNVSINSPTGGTGSLVLSGLPFANAGEPAITGNLHIGRIANSQTQDPHGFLSTSATSITFYYNRDGSTAAGFSSSNLNGQVTPFFVGSITYLV